MTRRFGNVVTVDGAELHPARTHLRIPGPQRIRGSPRRSMLCRLINPPVAIRVLGLEISQTGEALPHPGRLRAAIFVVGDLSARENLDFMASIYTLGRRRAARRRARDRRTTGRIPAAARGLPQRRAETTPGAGRRALHEHLLLLLDGPPAPWIRRAGAISGRVCLHSLRTAPPCWSPRITWTRPSAVTPGDTDRGRIVANGSPQRSWRPAAAGHRDRSRDIAAARPRCTA